MKLKCIFRYYVCEKHFLPEDFNPYNRRMLKKGVISSRFLPSPCQQVPKDPDSPSNFIQIKMYLYSDVAHVSISIFFLIEVLFPGKTADSMLGISI